MLKSFVLFSFFGNNWLSVSWAITLDIEQFGDMHEFVKIRRFWNAKFKASATYAKNKTHKLYLLEWSKEGGRTRASVCVRVKKRKNINLLTHTNFRLKLWFLSTEQEKKRELSESFYTRLESYVCIWLLFKFCSAFISFNFPIVHYGIESRNKETD